MSQPPRYRYFTFVAQAPFDAPYEFANESSYCEWDHFSSKDVVIGYVQYKHPRCTPVWPFTRAVFSPSTLQYMNHPHKIKSFTLGTPKLPFNYIKPPVSLVLGPKYEEFCIEHEEKRLVEQLASRLASRKRKAEEVALQRHERWAALNIYNKSKSSQ